MKLRRVKYFALALCSDIARQIPHGHRWKPTHFTYQKGFLWDVYYCSRCGRLWFHHEEMPRYGAWWDKRIGWGAEAKRLGLWDKPRRAVGRMRS